MRVLIALHQLRLVHRFHRAQLPDGAVLLLVFQLGEKGLAHPSDTKDAERLVALRAQRSAHVNQLVLQ